MVEYAAQDVLYLPMVYHAMRRQIEQAHAKQMEQSLVNVQSSSIHLQNKRDCENPS